MCGDFNIHVDKPSLSNVQKFMDMLQVAGFHQYVHEATHIKGHTLDLIFCRESDNLVLNIDVSPSLPSDHHVVSCQLAMPKPLPLRKVVEFRKLRTIDNTQFCEDIRTSRLILEPADNLTDLIDQYNSTLSDLLDRHAPKMRKLVTLRPNTPWYDDKIRMAKQK